MTTVLIWNGQNERRIVNVKIILNSKIFNTELQKSELQRKINKKQRMKCKKSKKQRIERKKTVQNIKHKKY